MSLTTTNTGSTGGTSKGSGLGGLISGIGTILGGPIGGIAGGLISTIFGNKAQREQDRINFERQRSHNMEMAKYNFDNEVKMWNMQNEYNDPAAEMRRLKDAGLNPHLMYGNGAQANRGGDLTNPQAETARYNVSPRMSPLEMISNYQAIRGREANIDLTRKNVRLTEQKEILAGVDQALKSAQILSVNANTDFRKILNKYQTSLSEKGLKLVEANLNNALYRYTLMQDDKKLKGQDLQIKKQILGKTEAEANTAKKKWELFQRSGIDPNSSTLMQFLIQAAAGERLFKK